MYLNSSKIISVTIYWYRLLVLSVLVRPYVTNQYRLENLGHKGANWWVPTHVVSSNWIVYSAGVGEDISFDKALIKKYNCQVFAFDPTPKAIAYVKVHPVKQFKLIPIGLWKTDTILKFFEPAEPSHVSHSILNLQHTDAYFKAACFSVKSVMKRLGHSRLNFIKLDIEGAEFAVINQMLLDNIQPTLIAMEFDQPCSVSVMVNCIHNLLSYNYQLIKQDHFNFVFIKQA